jgi:hypothetical protein
MYPCSVKIMNDHRHNLISKPLVRSVKVFVPVCVLKRMYNLSLGKFCCREEDENVGSDRVDTKRQGVSGSALGLVHPVMVYRTDVDLLRYTGRPSY